MEIKLNVFLTIEEKTKPFDDIRKEFLHHIDQLKEVILEQILQQRIKETSSPGLVAVAKDDNKPKDH